MNSLCNRSVKVVSRGQGQAPPEDALGGELQMAGGRGKIRRERTAQLCARFGSRGRWVRGSPAVVRGAGWRDGLSSRLLGLPQFAANAEKEGPPSKVKGH